ncbi:MAG: nicotinate-nucleotide adenylyltransferase [Candidatus Omnitrophica bacterium]|nr:nicotinate-nucleotide adenylyltransferase [Candidatus Omnitrophota bacterium]
MGKSESKNRVGILGGTFNPPHNGHLLIAQEAYTQLGLNKVLFIPGRVPPHKNRLDIIDVELRYEMVKLLLKDKPEFSISRIEIEKIGVSYSVETLKILKAGEPDTQFYFIVGSDAIPELKTWKNIEEILTLCKFAIGMRPGFKDYQVPGGMVFLEGVFPDISSGRIREMLRNGEAAEHIIGHSVNNFIKERKLYQ